VQMASRGVYDAEGLHSGSVEAARQRGRQNIERGEQPVHVRGIGLAAIGRDTPR